MNDQERIIELYQAATDRSEQDIQRCVLDLLQRAISSESAILGDAFIAEGETSLTAELSISLTNSIPKQAGVHYQEVKQHDVLPEWLSSRLEAERTSSASMAVLNQTVEHYVNSGRPSMAEFCNEYGFSNAMASLVRSSNPRHGNWAWFFRSGKRADFREDECRRLGMLLPHAIHAIQIHCRAIRPLSEQVPASPTFRGLVTTAGDVLHGEGRCIELLQDEFPSVHHGRLPSELLARLVAADQTEYAGERVVVRAMRSHRLLSISVRPATPIDRLTQREKQIASLVRDGLDQKSIARQLGIAPFTVRNHLSAIYGKLSVHSAAQLIAAIVDADQK